MPDLDIKAVVDKLLVFMVDEMEENGTPISSSFFHFGPDNEHRAAFVSKNLSAIN
jgi:hypothetical protein